MPRFFHPGWVPDLRPQSHAALQRQGFSGEVLEIGVGQLDTHPANLCLRVSVMSHRRHLDIGLEGIRIGVLEVLQLGGPGDGADDIDIDAVGAPLGGGYTGQSAALAVREDSPTGAGDNGGFAC